jgi:hypothetical protein
VKGSVKYIIVDLDNCISDDAWRLNQIKLHEKNVVKRYHHYHMLSSFDRARNLELIDDNIPIVFTARPEAYRTITEEWLYRNNVHPSYILMRAACETRTSPVLKSEMMRTLHVALGIMPEDIALAIDDRQDVVDAYAAMGVNARRVAIHEREIKNEVKL